jgi:hypothetical protein
LSLMVDDAGLMEKDEGVEATAPWSVVKSFFANDKLIAIELQNGQWACVPLETLQPVSSSAEALLATLEAHGIQRNTHPNLPSV